MGTTGLIGAFAATLRRRTGIPARTLAAMAVLLPLMAEHGGPNA